VVKDQIKYYEHTPFEDQEVSAMKKTYAFATNAQDWNTFLDGFNADLNRYPQLAHIGWSSTYTGGVGKLTIDYGEWSEGYCRWCKQPLDDRWTDYCSACAATMEQLLQG